mmetsp:Transcript_24947/g.38587  ORF Transcript_24947/g.38587 Transcript_24947/m.38587 type:complete len:209 (+) Transcript_24947:84-710(+)
MSGTPAWAEPGAGIGQPVAPPPAAYVGTAPPVDAATAASAAKGPAAKNIVQRMLSILNLGICSAMICAATYTILEVDFNTDDFASAFVAIYMILFSSLLALYEFMWWAGVGWINKYLRKNFGFLYGIKGKAAFIIFTAFLNFGLDAGDTDVGDSGMDVEKFTFIVGIVMVGSGVAHLLVYFKYYEYFANYQAPSAGLNPTSDEPAEPV